MRSVMGLLVAIVCAACESEEPKITPEDEPSVQPRPQKSGAPEDGIRLKRRWLETDDGAVEQLGWWDSARKEPCAFRHASDGKLRCLPTVGVHECDRRTGAWIAFSDTECKIPFLVGFVSTECDKLPRFAFAKEEGVCLDGVSVYRAIESVPQVVPESVKVDGECVDYADKTPVQAVSLELVSSDVFVGVRVTHF
jgi:hypothetical protein